MKELDALTEAALERILQSKHGDAISAPPLNSSETVSQRLDLKLWNQIPLVLIDESDPDHPVIIDLFETDQSGSGTRPNSSSPALSNVTSEAQKHKVAVKLVSVGLWLHADVLCTSLEDTNGSYTNIWGGELSRGSKADRAVSIDIASART